MGRRAPYRVVKLVATLSVNPRSAPRLVEWIPDIVTALKQYGISAMVHEPLGDAAEAKHEYGITLASLDDYRDLDVLIFAVSHQQYIDQRADLLARLKPGGVVVDVKSALDPKAIPAGLRYWSL